MSTVRSPSIYTYTDSRFPGFEVIERQGGLADHVQELRQNGQPVYTFDTNGWYKGKEFAEGVFEGMAVQGVRPESQCTIKDPGISGGSAILLVIVIVALAVLLGTIIHFAKL